MNLTIADFARSFGVLESDISLEISNLIKKFNFEITEIEGKERDNLVIRIIEKIRYDEQSIASPGRKDVWQEGWSENLEAYKASGGSYSSLIPKFIREGLPIRWFGKYYKTTDPKFELNYITVLRAFIFESFFSKLDCLYEFGAGTGFNLLQAHNSLPHLKLIGTDFVSSSVELMNKVGSDFSIPLTASLFDMLNPSAEDFRLDRNSGVLTFGSLEQLGGEIEPIVNYLCNQKPKICVHIEPAIELYNSEDMEDYLATWFQGKRGYSSGLIALLQDYESRGLLLIKKIQRLNFGSLMMEGYNLIVWEPI